MATRNWTGADGTGWAIGGNWSGGIAPVAGDTVIISESANWPTLTGTAAAPAALNRQTISLLPGDRISAADIVLTNVVLGAGTTLEAAAGLVAASVIVGDGGTLTVGEGAVIRDAYAGAVSGSVMTLGAGTGSATLVNDGTIAASGGAELQITAWGGGLVNDGRISQDGGILTIGRINAVHDSVMVAPPTVVSGTGRIDLANGALLQLDGVLTGGTIAFGEGPATLRLFQPAPGAVIAPFAGGAVSGFQSGDAIDLWGVAANGLSYAGGELSVSENGTPVARITLTGTWSAANFALATDGYGGSRITFASAPGSAGPVLHEPGSEAVTANGSVGVPGTYADARAATNPGGMYLRVWAAVGTLAAQDGAGAAAGSGTGAITVIGSYAAVNVALASLRYTAAGIAGGDTIRFDLWNQYGVETVGTVGVTVRAHPDGGADGGAGSGGGMRAAGPAITAPDSLTVAAGAIEPVGGVSVQDSFAAITPGTLALNVTDRTGGLSMLGGSGPVAGSGGNALHLVGTLNQLNAALGTLAYTAAPGGGLDSIVVDVWDQAGVEITRAIAVTPDRAPAVAAFAPAAPPDPAVGPSLLIAHPF